MADPNSCRLTASTLGLSLLTVRPSVTSVTQVREQVARLATQPCIVIWGGNNENEAALNWYQQSRDRRDVYLADYVKLYVDTVMPAIRRADYDAANRPAVDTSPSNGLLATEPYVKRWSAVRRARRGVRRPRSEA